jgi:hypothetical protein
MFGKKILPAVIFLVAGVLLFTALSSSREFDSLLLFEGGSLTLNSTFLPNTENEHYIVHVASSSLQIYAKKSLKRIISVRNSNFVGCGAG